jgi:hypothetical protein
MLNDPEFLQRFRTANSGGRFIGLPCNVTIDIHANLLRSYTISSAGEPDAGRKTDKAWDHRQRDGLPQQCAAENGPTSPTAKRVATIAAPT